jgi:hypothetical protein
MTVVLHTCRFIFLKTRKTAGTSIEQWLAPHVRRGDMIATATESSPLPVPFWSTPNTVTGMARLERKFKKFACRVTGHPRAMAIRQHMSAAEVRAVVGEEVWRSYYKVSVERDPWDRAISLWRWRQKRFATEIGLDAFLDLVEGPSGGTMAHDFSNLPMYTIDGEIAVDRVVRFERLNEDLQEVCDRIGLPAKVADLPRAKGNVRPASDRVAGLTATQIARIARIAAREIELFGYTPPPPKD